VLDSIVSVLLHPWNKLRWLILVLLVLVTALLLLAWRAQPEKLTLHWSGSNQSYSLSAVKSPAEKQKGLGDTVTMPHDQGMIFLSDNGSYQCFWMKDMQFPIDIIWLDAGKKVKFIENNVQPNTYPKTFCHNAKYVIELNAGETVTSNLKISQTVVF
jgi:uncharacterized membrane protein (UPF0127 family)